MASPLTPAATNLFSLGVIATQIALIAAVAGLAYPRTRQRIAAMLSEFALPIGMFYSTIATLGSLFYSNVAGLAPCELCWFQRIFMYPQSVLFLMAIWKGDKKIVDYALVLSSIGAIIATYHYYIQLGGVPLAPCALVGYSVSCADKFILQYGYITIPMMALTAFAAIIVTSIAVKLNRSDKA